MFRKFPIPPRNIEKAKALIKEAGVPTPITIELMVPNQPDLRQVAEVLQAMAAEGGFDLKLRLTEFATSLQEGTKGNFQLYLIGWSGRIDPDQNVINHLGCNTPFNWGKYCNETTQAALNEARTVTEHAKRKAAYEKALTQIEADKPLIYLYHQAWIFAHTAKLEGYRQPPDGIIRPQDIKLAR
jgi:peptide/nickel transport system substrate-binding protein